MEPVQRPLALTLGDPAGIGPDITLLAYRARRQEPIPPFVLVGDPELLNARASALGLNIPIETVSVPHEAIARFESALPVLPEAICGEVVPGRPDAAAAPAVKRSIERAVELVLNGEAGGVVTNPISKAMLYGAGFTFPGHTEFLASLAGLGSSDVAMMLAARELKVVPATIHIPLEEVPRSIDKELILKKLRIVAQGLGRHFGLRHPRIAVTGLNPHAGEDGGMGREEIETIGPAIEAAQTEGLNVSGPHAADSLFHAEARKSYDVAVAMYHDQALIPFKTLAFDTGVNVTLGLPFVRTSPDHGTAFPLAATGKASPRSLIEALRLAGAMRQQAESAP